MIKDPARYRIFEYEYIPMTDNARPFPEYDGFYLCMYSDNILELTRQYRNGQREFHRYAVSAEMVRSYIELLSRSEALEDYGPKEMYVEPNTVCRYVCRLSLLGFTPFVVQDLARQTHRDFRDMQGRTARRLLTMLEDVSLLMEPYKIHLAMHEAWTDADVPELPQQDEYQQPRAN